MLDPFAGTGSVLIACAHYGGYVLGADIDSTLVHGRGCSSRAGSKQKYRGTVLRILAQCTKLHNFVLMP